MRVRLAQRRGTILRYSPFKRRVAIYTKCKAICTAEHFEFSTTTLKTAYNLELARQGVDAFVEQCSKIRSPNYDHVTTDIYVAIESPLGAAVVALIIFIIKAVALATAAITILNAASAFVETIFPKVKLYAPDGTEFTDWVSFQTYMRNWNTSQGYPYTCAYCCQGFQTEDARDKHQTECPWKGGLPNGGDIWQWIFLTVAAVGAIVIVPRVLDIFG